MHSFIVIYFLQNAELDLQQEEYALSKDIDVSLVHVLGNIYFLMSPYDLDELCEWVRNKSFFIDKDFTIDGLLEYEEQCSSSSISSRVLEITNEEHNDHINYQPVCSEWQKERCALLGLTFIRVNHPHLTQPSMIAVSHCPISNS